KKAVSTKMPARAVAGANKAVSQRSRSSARAWSAHSLSAVFISLSCLLSVCMIGSYNHMTMTDPTPILPSADGEPSDGGESAPWTQMVAWRLLPEPARCDLAILLNFVAAVRAVADHPALTPERKESALAALAAPFSPDTVTTADPAAPAVALAGLLAARGIDTRPAWQILQAAGQDLRKSRYRDWSDLLTWCRFGATPVAVLGFGLMGARVDALRKAENIGLAWQLIEIVHRVQSHYRWLGRVYLPERWFTDARADMADLSFTRISPSLAIVLGRALDQAGTLLDEVHGSGVLMPDFRARAALAGLLIETRARVRILRRADGFAPNFMPGAFARRWIALRALIMATRRR
ncbi:MAG: phytoene/squalene synthetase, partial [Alphaproteobacteria bacterium]